MREDGVTRNNSEDNLWCISIRQATLALVLDKQPLHQYHEFDVIFVYDNRNVIYQIYHFLRKLRLQFSTTIFNFFYNKRLLNLRVVWFETETFNSFGSDQLQLVIHLENVQTIKNEEIAMKIEHIERQNMEESLEKTNKQPTI